jgi:hypothetical protein
LAAAVLLAQMALTQYLVQLLPLAVVEAAMAIK